MLVVLATGCRPKDAAYIVQHRSVRPNDHRVLHMRHTYQAFVPAAHNKTGRDYLFLVPQRFDRVAECIQQLTHTGYPTYEKLDRGLKDFYASAVMRKALGDRAAHGAGRYYCMRTARAYRATEWVALVAEYRYMGWKPEPLNPLQHESEKMTMEHYAAKGVADESKVQQRCLQKYGADPAKRQPWMAAAREPNDIQQRTPGQAA